jgi:flagellar biosynthesis GTPase FlhF
MEHAMVVADSTPSSALASSGGSVAKKRLKKNDEEKKKEEEEVQEAASSTSKHKLELRNYQQVALARARDKNVIMVGTTGVGM